MKKLIAYTLCVLLVLPTIFVPAVALASSKTLSDFPAAFESLQNSTSNLYYDSLNIGGWSQANNNVSGNSITVENDGDSQGSYLNVTNADKNAFCLRLYPTDNAENISVKFSFDFRMPNTDNNNDGERRLYWYGAGGNTNIGTVNKSGVLTLFGEGKLATLASNVWYNLDITYNLATNYFKWKLTKKSDSSTVSRDGFYTGKNFQSITQIRFFDGRMVEKTSQKSELHLDNISFYEISPLYKDVVSENDFSLSGLSADGTQAPEGFSLEGAASGTDGAFMSDGAMYIKTTASNTVSLKKTFDVALYGKYRFETELGDFNGNAKRSVKINNADIVTFSDGSIYAGTNVIGTYSDGNVYTVTIDADTAAKTAQVRVAEKVALYSLRSAGDLAYIDTVAISGSDIPFSSVSLDITSISGFTSTYTGSFNIYNNSGMHLISSTPYDGASDIDPCNISLLFTNPVVSISSLKINGEENGSYLVNSSKRNEVSLNVSTYLEYEKENTLSFDATDIFGETKPYTIKLTTKPKYEFGDILITSSASNVTASVTGKANDGNTYNFDLILANFSSSNGKLLSLDKTSFALTSSDNSYTCTSTLSDGSFYRAYLWEGISTMKSILPQKTFGTPAAFAVDSSAQGFKQDPDTGIVSAKIAGINNAGSSFMVLHPSKTMADISGASNLTDVISYIAQYDELTSDFISFPVAGGGGSYGVAVNSDGNVVFTPSAIEYIDIAYINLVRDAINAPVINVKNLVTLYNDVLCVDDTYIASLSMQQETCVNSSVTEDRSALSDGRFATFKEFTDAYYDALCLSLIKYAKGSADAKAVLTSYADKVALSSFGTYSAYSNLSNEAKEYVYSRIASKKVNALSELENLFNDSVILAQVKYAAYQQDIGKVISDHKAYMSLDVSVYNTVSNTGNVHSALLGKDFSDISAFKSAFNTAVQNQKAAEGTSSQGPVSNVGSTSSSSGLSSVSLPSVSAPAQDTPNVFGDIASYEWASEAINYLAKNNVISGKANGIFAPSDYITREEFAKIAVMAFVGYTDANNSGFNDVGVDSWYAPYVAKAKETGLVTGIGDGTFGVGRCITREDIAVILCRAASLKGISLTNGTSSFADSAMISDYAKSSVDTLYSSKIINGTPDGSFNPKAFATRAEAAKMLYEIIKKGGGI